MLAVFLGGLRVRKFWVVGRTLLASKSVKEIEKEQGDRLLQVACQVSALALENVLSDASTYTKRRPKGTEALAAFKRSEKERATQ